MFAGLGGELSCSGEIVGGFGEGLLAGLGVLTGPEGGDCCTAWQDVGRLGECEGLPVMEGVFAGQGGDRCIAGLVDMGTELGI